MSFLEIRDLTYTYPNSDFRAVNGLDLDGDRGEMIAVIGPNAAGKSTFALLLKGLIKPEFGKIRINGNEQAGAGPDSRVGILFSNPENQLVTSIVEEDIAFGLEILGEDSLKIRERVNDVLERLGIEHLRKRMPHLMSGGEQQMAALAGLLVLDPDILILDEPTTYLDPDARVAVLAAMRDLADQGKIILLITHDMKEAASADRVVLIDHGRAAIEGPPEELFSHPAIGERYGIHPPFLMGMVLEMRAMGIGAKWPSDPRLLARAFIGGMHSPGEFHKEEVSYNASIQTGEPALTFDGIRFRYEPETPRSESILNGVDLIAEKGTVTLVCGSNGSGKSTLLQMSNGLISPDEGRIYLGERQLREWRKKPGGVPGQVALLFQNPERQVFSDTVFEDIAFGPRNMGVPSGKIEDRVRKAARWVGLNDAVLDRPVYTLSGGQMRRVAVAGVLAMESGVLVLDEPTDGLDPGGANEFFNSARRYCDETGTAIVMATHAVPEQIANIDHFAHLADGRIQSSGPPSNILTGSARTLPGQFLPDHLILREELLRMGSVPDNWVLDPVTVRKRLLSAVKGIN